MLGEPDRELVAGAVDGDLPDDRESLFRRLLADSADARSLFHQLLADRQALQSLPFIPAPANTADIVLRRIGRLPRVTPTGSYRVLGRWTGYAVAASVFLAAGGTAYLAVRFAGGDQAQAPNLAQGRPRHDNRLAPQVSATEALTELLPPPRPGQDPSHGQAIATELDGPKRPELAPLPRTTGSGSVVGFSPEKEGASIQEVDVRLPFLTRTAELDRPANRDRLLADMSAEPATRIDLFCGDLFKAGELFEAAARKAGLNLSVDAATGQLARNRLVTGFCVYTESLTPEAAVALLKDLAEQVRGAGGSVIGSCHVYPAGVADQRELRELLGIDPGPWVRSKPKPAAPPPLSAGTGDQIAARLGAGKTAIELTHSPITIRTVPAVSKEVRSFLAVRGERKPGTVALYMVFRVAN